MHLKNEAFKIGKNQFAVNCSWEFVISPTYFNVKKRYGLSVSEVNLMFLC